MTGGRPSRDWTPEEIRSWVDSQDWYQTIPVGHGIVTPGKTASGERLALLDLGDLNGRSVLDVGCNSGMYCFECKRRNAGRVVGIDLSPTRLTQARTLADIMGLDVEFHQMDLHDATSLGRFDLVLCLAVVTEVTDLIRAILDLKLLTRGELFLELAVYGAGKGDYRRPFRFLRWFGPGLFFPSPMARLRSIKGGWALAPDLRFLNALVGEEIEVQDLGPSVRYRMLKLTRKASGGSRP